MSKVITIFGSSFPAETEYEYKFGYELGAKLAKNGFEVCTGGFYGIMEAASKGALENGSEVYGVTVNLWNKEPNKYITREIRCSTMFERIEKLMEIADGFVVLQGGTGTLLELSAVWEYANKGLVDGKPIVCHSKMWRDVVDIMDKQLILENRKTGQLKWFNSADEIVHYLSAELN